MEEVMIFFYTRLFLLGIMGNGMQGEPMEIACVEKNKTGFLFFYTTDDV
jgi:hypothetical protein